MITIKADNICKKYGANEVIKDLNIKTCTSEYLGVYGANGSGKSTLLRILAGQTEPDSGIVEVSESGNMVSGEQLAMVSAMVSPKICIPHDLTFNALQKIYKLIGADYRKLAELISYFGLSSFSRERFKSFSTGMLQRAKLIIAFSKSPNVLFLDEAFSNMDDDGRNCLDIILKKNRQQLLCIMSSNSKNDLRICNNIIELGAVCSGRDVTCFKKSV